MRPFTISSTLMPWVMSPSYIRKLLNVKIQQVSPKSLNYLVWGKVIALVNLQKSNNHLLEKGTLQK